MGEKTLQLHSPDKLGQNSRLTFELLPSCCVCAGTRKKYTDTRHTNICPHTSSTNQRPRRCAPSDATVVGGGGARCRVVLCASKGEATKTKALKNTPLAPITFHPNERTKRLTVRAGRHASSAPTKSRSIATHSRAAARTHQLVVKPTTPTTTFCTTSEHTDSATHILLTLVDDGARAAPLNPFAHSLFGAFGF